MGEWDPDAVRRLFNVAGVPNAARAAGGHRAHRRSRSWSGPRSTSGPARAADLAGALARPPARRPSTPTSTAAVRGLGGLGRWRGRPSSCPSTRSRLGRGAWLADPAAPKWVHDAKELRDRPAAEGCDLPRGGLRHAARRVPAGPRRGRLPAGRAVPERYLGLDVLAEVRPRTARASCSPTRRRRSGRRRRRWDSWRPVMRSASSGPGWARAATRRRDAAVGRPGPDAGRRRPPRRRSTWRRCPRTSATGWRRSRRRSTAGRRAVQHRVAAAAGRDPVREAPAAGPQADAEGPRALHRRGRAGEAPRPAPDRRRDARLPRARQAQVDLPGRPARRW